MVTRRTNRAQISNLVCASSTFGNNVSTVKLGDLDDGFFATQTAVLVDGWADIKVPDMRSDAFGDGLFLFALFFDTGCLIDDGGLPK